MEEVGGGMGNEERNAGKRWGKLGNEERKAGKRQAKKLMGAILSLPYMV